MHPLRSGSAVAVAVLLGAALGLGFFTLFHAEGLSYLSDDPRACANCHVMNEVFEGWQKGPHHAVATCNDCHVPHDFLGKWLSKGLNGFHHSKAFTLQDFHEPIQITRRNAEALQGSCLHCHGEFVHEVVAAQRAADDPVRCVHCHRGVGHGAAE
ncbi:MAG: cytochrome c nitrite reductase small subunit [Proteobacteria bacterium]|nr:MAG: cytochrome c nitrite reductase small subunit [Pseudomonadota bacterium]